MSPESFKASINDWVKKVTPTEPNSTTTKPPDPITFDDLVGAIKSYKKPVDIYKLPADLFGSNPKFDISPKKYSYDVPPLPPKYPPAVSVDESMITGGMKKWYKPEKNWNDTNQWDKNPIKDDIEEKGKLAELFKKLNNNEVASVPKTQLTSEDLKPFKVFGSSIPNHTPFTFIVEIKELHSHNLFLDSNETKFFRNPILRFDFSEHEEDATMIKPQLLGSDFSEIKLSLFNLLGELKGYNKNLFEGMKTAWIYNHYFIKQIPLFGAPESSFRIILLE